MILSGSVLAMALALVTAQGPHARPVKAKAGAHVAAGTASASAKKRRAAPAPSVAVERRATSTEASAPVLRERDAAVTTSSADGGEGSPASDIGAAAPAKSAKTKVYTFGAMDVEGKLKTPQLLYFLNRVKLELEMSAPDHRSFMKELQRSADDPSL